MKNTKLFLLSVIMTIAIMSNAQSRIGFTFSEIKQELNEYKFTIDKIEGIRNPVLSIAIKHAVISYLFNDDLECIQTIVFPYEDTDYRWYCSKYDIDGYRDKNGWRLIVKNGVLGIIKGVTSDGTKYFIINQIE